MANTNWLVIIVIVIIAALVGGWYLTSRSATAPTPTPILMPASQPQGSQAIYENADSNLIRVSSPAPGASIATSTFVVSGQARGNWYFEASFPLEVVTATGTRLTVMPVQAQGEWMTTEFVPFSATATIPAWYRGLAVLILHKDNPSGLPENDASISIPIQIR